MNDPGRCSLLILLSELSAHLQMPWEYTCLSERQGYHVVYVGLAVLHFHLILHRFR